MMDRGSLKHVEFYSKNKFEKLVHLVGFIVRMYHDARSPECQNQILDSEFCKIQKTIYYLLKKSCSS